LLKNDKKLRPAERNWIPILTRMKTVEISGEGIKRKNFFLTRVSEGVIRKRTRGEGGQGKQRRAEHGQNKVRNRAKCCWKSLNGRADSIRGPQGGSERRGRGETGTDQKNVTTWKKVSTNFFREGQNGGGVASRLVNRSVKRRKKRGGVVQTQKGRARNSGERHAPKQAGTVPEC